MRISIVGTGYVGLVTGACLAAKGHHVTCVDVDPQRVAALNGAQSPIFERGLDELLREVVGRRLHATSDLAEAIQASEVTFIAVGTPFDGTSIDLTAVLRATQQIGEALRHKDGYHVVVVKSTVVPGTTDGCVLPLLESASGKKCGTDFGLGMNPEFLSEGEAVHDFLFPDRIIIGASDARSLEALQAIYASFPDAPVIGTNPRTAEMIKYASNALLATLISFANELANLGARQGGIDTIDVMRGVHLSQYFRGRNGEGLPAITGFLRAGCGFGGSCLPKDVKALIAHGERLGEDMPILKAVIRTNDMQPRQVVDLLRKHWSDLHGVPVAVLGLAFKPETNDVRESPAFPIVRELTDRGAVVRAYDPVALADARPLLPRSVHVAETLSSAVQGVAAVIVVTAWEQFAGLPQLLREQTPAPVLIDCRRMFDKNCLPRYEGIGM